VLNSTKINCRGCWEEVEPLKDPTGGGRIRGHLPITSGPEQKERRILSLAAGEKHEGGPFRRRKGSKRLYAEVIAGR